MRMATGVLFTGVLFLGSLTTWGAEPNPAPKSPQSSAPTTSHVSSALPPSQSKSTATPLADHYVREALAAELAGNNAQRDVLLKQALAVDPNCRAARWQAGLCGVRRKMVQPDGNGRPIFRQFEPCRVSPAAAESHQRGLVQPRHGFHHAGGTQGGTQAAQGSSVDTYRTAALSPAGIDANAELARWCHSKQLLDEERAHWTQVLYEDATNTEAQTRLGLHWYQGNLLTTAQIDAIKRERAVEAKQLAEWKPVVSGWRKSLTGTSASEQSATLAEMRAVTDPAVIPALEWAAANEPARSTAHRDIATPFQRAAVGLLGHLADQRATYTLVQWSVMSKQADVRTAAADALKKRPWHDFIPLLMAGLANPVQFDYSLSFDPTLGLAIYRAVTSQEGRDSISRVEYSNSISGLLPAFVGSHDSGLASNGPATSAGVPQIRTASPLDGRRQTLIAGPRSVNEISGASAVARQSQALATSVAKQNEQHRRDQRRIDYVLERVVGKKVTPTSAGTADEAAAIPDSANVQLTVPAPEYWWNWWADYTGTYLPDKPVSSTTIGDGTYTNRSQYSTLYRNPLTARSTGLSAGGRDGMLRRRHAGRHADRPAGDREIANRRSRFGAGCRHRRDGLQTSDGDDGPSAGGNRAGHDHPRRRPSHARTSVLDCRQGMADGQRGANRRSGAFARRCSAEVTAIKTEAAAPVYNLTVADFGTYFVGSAQILVHDNTPRLPSRALLPGFVAERQ